MPNSGSPLEIGFKPYGSYQGGDLDSINLSNGYLNIHIPLIALPERGDISYAASVVYQNKGWSVFPNCNSITGVCSPVWQWKGKGVQLNTDSPDDFGAGQGPLYNGSKVMVYTAFTSDGSTHRMAQIQSGGVESLDGTEIWYDGTPFPNTGGIARNSKGLRVGGSPSFVDLNGNFFSFASPNYIDTLGRVLPGPSAGTPTTDFSGCTGPRTVTSATIFTFPGYAGSTRQFKLCTASVALQSNFQASGYYNDLLYPITEAHPTTGMIQSVVIYNGTSWATSLAWTFEYDSRNPGDSPSVNYGDLTKITLPTGGTISYAWGFSSPCGFSSSSLPTPVGRQVISRTVDANDGAGPHAWTYNSGIVTDPSGNDTAHTFTAFNGSCSSFETETQYFEGSKQSGHLLRTVNTDYRWLPSPFESQDPGSMPAAINVFPKIITTTWPSGQFSKVEKDYDFNLVFMDPVNGWTTGSYGNVIEMREYGYAGSGQTPPLLRRTDYTYKAFDGSPQAASYLAVNLVHLIGSVTTYDGAGTQVAKTTYNYDESSLQPSNVTTQHTTVSSIAGNRTSESHWLNTTGGTLTSTVQYYDTGTPYKMTDPGGHSTTNFYGPGFQSGTNFNGAYLTQVQNALNQNTYFDYDFNTGLRMGLKDPNGQVSTWDYDLFNRTLHAHAPDTGSTTWIYNDTQPPTFTASSTITALLNDVAEGDLDGLGRPVHTKLLSDPEGVDIVDTTYDGLGRVATVSNPHRTTTGATDGITTTYYDALGRAVQVAPPDGTLVPPGTDVSQCLAGNVCTSYSGNAATTTDQAGHQRRSLTDALGRLVEVDEPYVGTIPAQNDYATMQTDGNFVLYNPSGTALWATGTAGSGGSSIEIQDDGNLVLYIEKWQAGTYTTPSPGPFPTQTCSIGSALNTSQTLQSNQCIVSPHGQYMLYMAPNGNFYIYDIAHSVATWSANTYNHPGAYAVMQGDGNFCIYAADGTFLWMSGTNGTFAERLEMEDDGRIIIFRSAWSSGTSQGWSTTSMAHPACDAGTGTGWTGVLGTGQCFVSPNGRYDVIMQTDGNLVLYDRATTPVAALWSTGTAVNALSPGVALQTLYTYDALGNLLRVDQKGSAPSDSTQWRTRTFTYDSLSRLITAANPESGTLCYGIWSGTTCIGGYDADGNLLKKTSPAPNQTGTATQTISYCYDALHRITGKADSNQTCQNGQLPAGTAVVSYTYDQGINGLGRMTSLVDQAGTGTYTYDVMGRIATEQRTIAGVSKTISYEYNLDGSLYKLHYPSLRTVTYTPNGAGHAISAVDGNGTQYVNSDTHYPTGAEYQRFMPGIYFRTDMDPRLQISGFYSNNGQVGQSFIDKTYNYGPLHQNNGNVISITNNKDSSRTQSFTYDVLNRITAGWSSASTGPLSWGETYSIDAWGNLMISPMGGKAQGGMFQHAGDIHNHATGLGYDAAGNLTNYTVPGQYVYDPENRIQSTAGVTYTYDADGNRVKKSGGTSNTLYWYGSPGIVAESDFAGNLKSEYVFFNGQRIARIDLPAGNAHYYLSDHLNSTSMIISSSGAVEEESDYSPYGTEYKITSGTNHYKFTGKERDTESGLDYFGARYYTSAMGRFITPDWAAKAVDVPYAEFSDPQTLNLYSYVRNTPTVTVDVDGHDLKVDPQLQATVDSLRQQSSLFNEELAAHEGNGSPNLTIMVGNTPNDPNGSPTTGNTSATMSVHIQTISSPEEDPDHFDNYQGSVVTINKSVSKGDREDVIKHEIGHVHDDRTNTDQAGRDSQHTRDTHGKTPHDDRPEEQRANGFKNDVTKQQKEFAKRQKEEKKREEKRK